MKPRDVVVMLTIRDCMLPVHMLKSRHWGVARDTNPLDLWRYVEQWFALAAGSSGGGYWTEFRGTCDAVRSYVKAHPGCNLADLIAGIRHHYRTTATARASLARWIEAGKIAGVTLRRDGRRIVLETEADR